MNRSWEESFDVVIVGSGAAGLTAAITVAHAGMRPLIVEKSDLWGGSSALSGGGIWAPVNPLMQASSDPDSPEAAMTYLNDVVADAGPATSRERRLALLSGLPQMVTFLRGRGVDLRREPTQPDYHAERPGGRAGRLMEPAITDARRLGPWTTTLRRARRPFAVKTGESARISKGFSSLSSLLAIVGVILRHHLFLARGWDPLTGGAALVAQLMLAAQRAGAPVRLGCALREIVIQDGRAVGVLIEQEGAFTRVEAKRGVMLCAGGFAHNVALRTAWHGLSGETSAASPEDTGDIISLAERIGAATALMEEAWWGPVMVYPGGRIGFSIWERSLPFSMMVDATGRRFTNEAQSYDVIGREMIRLGINNAWLILDARHRQRYLFGAMRPRRTPKTMFDSGFFLKADSLDALARKCGLDPATLRQTVERFNGFARLGVDEDFGRGQTPYDRYWGDPNNRPNSNLGPIENAPFLATAIRLGDLGTKGGLLTDADGRALTPSGEPIQGLYAAGNSSASIMGRGYPGPGATLGPAMTFAFLAAQHIGRAAIPPGRANNDPS